MTAQEVIATIRAEIERLMCPEIQYSMEQLLSLLSTLEESEKPMNQEGLDEKTIRIEFHAIADKCFNEGIEGWEREKLIARHFYDLGCRRTAEKYDEIEYNRQRAEEPPVALVAIKPILPAALKPCIATFKEQGGSSEIPKDLEEAAEKYYDENKYEGEYCFECNAIEAFIAGAKWDREQMMKEAVEITLDFTHQITLPFDGPGFGKKGDKIRVIIVKEEENGQSD